MKAGAYDPIRALRVLQHHEVDFVVIGGFAGRLWGRPASRSIWTSVRSGAARTCRGLPPSSSSTRTFVMHRMTSSSSRRAMLAAGQTFTFSTDAGALDLLAAPAGGFDHASLKEAAHPIDLGNLIIDVVDLDDLIAMKRAAGRPKDRIEVEVLEAVRLETEQ
jgi:hypothetical protein